MGLKTELRRLHEGFLFVLGLPTETIEFVLSCYAIIWGVWLLMPDLDWRLRFLKELAPAWWWGAAVLALGLGNLYCLLVLHDKKSRRCASMMHFVFWLFIVMGTAQEATSPSIGSGMVRVVESAWVFIRLRPYKGRCR